jgi:CRISPR-associated protein Csh1
MINYFKIIGKTVLHRDGYYDSEDQLSRKRSFLKFQTLLPSPRKDGMERAVCLNFDLNKGEFCFLLDKELDEVNREYFFAFKLGAPNDRKKFLVTNNFESFLNLTFTDSLAYLEEKRKDKKSGPWFDAHVPVEYDTFLENILERFYVKKGEAYVLDESHLAPDQYEVFSRVKAQFREKQKDKDKPLPMDKVYGAFLMEMYRDGDKKNLPSIFLVKINGRHILEYENTGIGRAYVNLVYYDLYERFITEEIIKEKYCHVCGGERDVMGKLPLPMKFYGTTNPLYFENIKNKNAYKSFALCQACMTDVLTGMKFTETTLSDYIFGMTCYLIPALDEEDPLFEKKLRVAVEMLKKRGAKYRNDIEELESLLRKSSSKQRAFSFNLLFYFSEKQEFNILKYISDLELRELMKKMTLFDEFTDTYGLDRIGDFGNSLSLMDIRYVLFPSNRSHPNPDFKIYGKELLNFLENFLNNHKISYYEMINRFISIYRRRFHRDNVDRLSPFKMVGFLTLLGKINLLKEDNGMNEGQCISEVMKEEYKEFFAAHPEVYSDSIYRQGLFLLGTVISRVVYQQKRKGEGRKDSSTFLAKLNYEGIPARRVDKLVNDVKKYAIIYNVFEEPGIWGNITDRLQGIEKSLIKPDEVVFYILTGISFEDYLGMKYAKEKRLSQHKVDE